MPRQVVDLGPKLDWAVRRSSRTREQHASSGEEFPLYSLAVTRALGKCCDTPRDSVTVVPSRFNCVWIGMLREGHLNEEQAIRCKGRCAGEDDGLYQPEVCSCAGIITRRRIVTSDGACPTL